MNQPYMPDWVYPNQYDPYPQSNNYNFHNDFNSSPSQWGFTYPEHNFQQLYPPSSPSPQYFQDTYSIPPDQNRLPSILEMSMRESKQKSPNLMDSFQNNISSFQHNDDPIKMLEAMTQAQNARNRDIELMIQTLPSYRSKVTNHSVKAKESCCFGNQDSISEHSSELVQTSDPIDILASFSFTKIELEHEYDLEPQLNDSILPPDSIMTPVSLPDFTPFPESTLDPVPIHNEVESPIT